MKSLYISNAAKEAMGLEDDWIDHDTLASNFRRAMDGPQKRTGVYAQTIDLKDLKAGDSVELEKPADKC